MPRKVALELATLQYSPSSGWTSPLPGWDSDRTLVLVFAAPGYRDDWDPVAQVLRAYPDSHVLGCSTAGEIHGARLSDDTVVVAVARFAQVGLRSAVARRTGQDGSFSAGHDIASQLAGDELRAVMVLSDGLEVNGSELTRGLAAVLPESVVVTGGLAADGPRFGRTWVIGGGVPRASLVAAVGLYGDALVVGHGSQGGWDKFGPERLVTRSRGNVLYELDGRPALALYKEYLGELASGLPAAGLLFPLALRADADAEATLVRTILAVDEASQTLTFAGDLPQGALVQLMRANFERLIEGACGAALATAAVPVEGPVLSVGVSCVGRRLVLGERTEEEIEAVLDNLPEGAAQVGFYSYGEVSPLAAGRCELHNQTMTLTMLAERAAA